MDNRQNILISLTKKGGGPDPKDDLFEVKIDGILMANYADRDEVTKLTNDAVTAAMDEARKG